MLSANSESSQIEEVARIKEIYEQGVNNIDDVYNTLERKNKIQVNAPKLDDGMTPIKWNGMNLVTTTKYDTEWYSYEDTSLDKQTNKSRWANAETKDGSMWVWIPRYAYKITYTNVSDKSQGGTIDVVFLKDDTNKDFNGQDVTNVNYIDENGVQGAYIVHPAFKDGTKNGFANGEWDKEITGFWIAKFEAGYDGDAGNPLTAKDSDVKYSSIEKWFLDSTIQQTTDNYYGTETRKVGNAIKYPVFKPNRPSMNDLAICDAYSLCQSLTATNNQYGLSTEVVNSRKKVDSHLQKNSEWGAVAYLTHSKYGRNGEKVTKNNVSVNGENTIYAVTGYGGTTLQEDTSRDLAALIIGNGTGNWITTQGQLASSTGNIYGIYDLVGGLEENVAGYMADGNYYEAFGGVLKGESTKYKSKYEGTETGVEENYNIYKNKNRLGEAIWETSSSGSGETSWHKGYSNFMEWTSFSLVRRKWFCF